MTAALAPLPLGELPRDRKGWWLPADETDLPDCLHCGTEREVRDDHANRGYCRRCYRRWADNGYPDGGPPDRRTRGKADPMLRAEFVRRYRTTPVTALVRDLGISRRTAQRWKKDAELRPGVRRGYSDVEEPRAATPPPRSYGGRA